METISKTLFEILEDINENKLVMPAFQRNFEWDLPRIEKLWDSILQGYPFSTFLFWKLDREHVSSSNYFYVFARECTFDSKGSNDGCAYDREAIDFDNPTHPTIAVLDGQQRLTSLFLSLFGTVYKRPKNAKRKVGSRYILKLFLELDPNKIDETTAFNSKKYGIYFSERVCDNTSPSKFEVRKILNEEFRDPDTREIAIENIVSGLPDLQKQYATNALNRLCSAIYDLPLVTYTQVSELTQDDALEMFVRFNSGGKNLTKAQISMSILEVFWPNVQRDFETALRGKYRNFGTDFILRTGHMIYGDVIKSNIDQDLALTFKANFEKFKLALKNTSELFELMNYDISRFSSRWNIIIPIIYLVYNNENYIDSLTGLFSYLFRAILFQFYASGTTGKLQMMKTLIADNNFRLESHLLDSIDELRVTPAKIDDLLFAEKGSVTAGNVLYCLGINYIHDDYDYDEDHIHPNARFERSQPLGMTDANWSLARSYRNKLPNLQLLRSDINESKGDQDFELYYLSLPPIAKEKMTLEGFIPAVPQGQQETNYYKITNFLRFYEDRKRLLTDKITHLLNGDLTEAVFPRPTLAA